MPTADFGAQVTNTLENIRTSGEIHSRNKELIEQYKRDQTLNELSDATIARNLSRLKQIAEYADRPFDELEKEDMKDVVEWIHSKDYTDETVYTYKNVIKSFWRWLSDDDEHPEAVDWIKMTKKNGNDTLPKDLLTKEDIEAQANAAKNPRDEALIWTLYETGARIGELIDLTVGDIEDRQHGKKVVIDGKTGARRLPLVESVPFLNNWLNEHPHPENGAPLWCKIQQGGPIERLDPKAVVDVEDIHGVGAARAEKLRQAGIDDGRDLLDHSATELAEAAEVSESTADGWLDQFGPGGDQTPTVEQLGYRYICDKILTKNMERAGIDKPSNPHHYRHSRATELAASANFKQPQLCEWFGWVQGSDVPAKYIHLSGRDIDNAYDEMHGLKTVEEDEAEQTVQECPRCDELNERNDRFCSRCGQALDLDAAEELETAEEATTKAAKEEDLQLALQLVEAMRSDRDRVEEFVGDLTA